MPTPKQVRQHWARIHYHWEKLSDALCIAHRDDVLVYNDYAEESPYKTLHETWNRVLATTEKALAEAMRREIKDRKCK